MSARAELTGGVRLSAPGSGSDPELLTPQALSFLGRLQRELRDERRLILEERARRQLRFSQGELPEFPESTRGIREDRGWRVRPAPPDLMDRRVEITGPVERKMMINALNSGASTFMADFEDANSPTWQNCLRGQRNLIDAVAGTISLQQEERSYRLQPDPAVLLVRPRGWHLWEKHLLVDGEAMSASLFDFGLFVFHCGRALRAQGSGPYLYLPKLEGHLEARLWERACSLAEEWLGLPAGSIRVTVLVETVLAAFEMEEILYELRERAAGLNAGRWDYIFSMIKKFRDRPEFVLPDRSQVTMTVPFMRAYTDLLVSVCHRRGTHAIGGMSAFIPNRHDPELTEVAFERVRQDKLREVGDGFDGSWVAHPDLVPLVREVFDQGLAGAPNQLSRQRPEVVGSAAALLDVASAGGEVTDSGVAHNIEVGIRYLDAWLKGTGAAAIDNLMEDAATAEISRSQIWQWIRHGRVDAAMVRRESARIAAQLGSAHDEAAALFEKVALGQEYLEFFTLAGYPLLD